MRKILSDISPNLPSAFCAHREWLKEGLSHEKVLQWTVLIALSILIAGGGAWLAMRILSPRAGPAQPETGQRNVLYYRSTMMLGEISQTPRKDSMGMEMVPVFEGEEDTAIKVDPVTTQNMGLRTAHVTRGPVHRSIRTVGRIDFDETAVSEVTTRVPGWIEKLYVDSPGKLVHKGLLATAALMLGGIYALRNLPLDAIPDLSDTLDLEQFRARERMPPPLRSYYSWYFTSSRSTAYDRTPLLNRPLIALRQLELPAFISQRPVFEDLTVIVAKLVQRLMQHHIRLYRRSLLPRSTCCI